MSSAHCNAVLILPVFSYYIEFLIRVNGRLSCTQVKGEWQT